MIITKSSELAPGKLLTKEDELIFSTLNCDYKYRVDETVTHLRTVVAKYSNDIIFEELGLKDHTHRILQVLYGHPCERGIFPEINCTTVNSEKGRLFLLTKVAYFLFLICEELPVPPAKYLALVDNFAERTNLIFDKEVDTEPVDNSEVIECISEKCRELEQELAKVREAIMCKSEILYKDIATGYYSKPFLGKEILMLKLNCQRKDINKLKERESAVKDILGFYKSLVASANVTELLK